MAKKKLKENKVKKIRKDAKTEEVFRCVHPNGQTLVFNMTRQQAVKYRKEKSKLKKRDLSDRIKRKIIADLNIVLPVFPPATKKLMEKYALALLDSLYWADLNLDYEVIFTLVQKVAYQMGIEEE